MKTIRFQLLHRMVQFTTIITAICCIGCANFVDDILNDTGDPSSTDSDVSDNLLIIADMPIQEIEVLLAESDPVQVTVEVTGWLPDSCTAHHETHQGREETLSLSRLQPYVRKILLVRQS